MAYSAIVVHRALSGCFILRPQNYLKSASYMDRKLNFLQICIIRASGLGFRVEGSGFKVSGVRFRVQGSAVCRV